MTHLFIFIDVNIDNSAKIYLNFLKQDIKFPCDKKLTLFKNAESLFVDELWYPTNIDHSSWIQKLVSKFLKSGSLNFFQSLVPICNLDIKYAEELFYYLIVILLMSDNLGPLLVNKVKQFFQTKERSSDIDQSSIQCMLTTVHLIQNIRLPSILKTYFYSPILIKFKNNSYFLIKTLNITVIDLSVTVLKQTNFLNFSCSFERNLNFMEIANGAYSTKSYFSAIYYLELWCEEVFRKQDYNYLEGNKISFLYEKIGHSETNKLIKILKKVQFAKII